MAFQWMRRAAVLAVGAAALLLAGCSSGTIESQFNPTRIVAFGDAFADLGQNGARYTVNDTSVNNWTQFVAVSYNVPLASSAQGGTSYATGNARVTAKPDAAGNAATPTVTEQIDRFLAAGNSFRPTDLVIVNAGNSDVIVQSQALVEGRQARAQVLAATEQAGRELAAQVRRILRGGAERVLVVGAYNLGRSPWATAVNQAQLMQDASTRFNDELLVSMEDLGANVLYVDASFYFNLVTASPGSYGLSNGTTPVCTAVDPGPGIGTGTGQLNANLCNANTILPNVIYDNYVFADRVYPTPKAHRLFGEYAYNRVRDRW